MKVLKEEISQKGFKLVRKENGSKGLKKKKTLVRKFDLGAKFMRILLKIKGSKFFGGLFFSIFIKEFLVIGKGRKSCFWFENWVIWDDSLS